MNELLHRIYAKLAQTLRERRLRRGRLRGTVLMLHGVGSGKGGEFDISVDAFTRLLANIGRQCVSLENWTEAPDGFYALTFDDVDASVYTNAWPLLRQRGVPFTLFVNTGLLDREGYITTRQLREMARSGLCTVGSHGRSHGFFRHLDTDARLADLTCSKRTLEEATGRKVTLYAFPYGSVHACGTRTPRLAATVYSYAFSTLSAPITRARCRRDWFLPRVNITEDSRLCR